jgi:AcrR family transcriptional regulator
MMAVSESGKVGRGRGDTKPQFDRESWLRSALEILAQKGQAKLRVNDIVADLGVTKGSFYHHFKDRADFVQALLEYWSAALTDEVIAKTESLNDLSARERLLFLMKAIQRQGLDRYDIAFRSWAAQEPAVAAMVEEVDTHRYKFIRSLFSEMGFTGSDLEDRVRIFLVFHSAQGAVFIPNGRQRSDAMIKRWHAFFTHPTE